MRKGREGAAENRAPMTDPLFSILCAFLRVVLRAQEVPLGEPTFVYERETPPRPHPGMVRRGNALARQRRGMRINEETVHKMWKHNAKPNALQRKTSAVDTRTHSKVR